MAEETIHAMKEQDATNDNDESPPKPAESELSLDRRFMYQNPSTGGISSTSLTVRQLCRMFCPPSITGQAAVPSRFTGDTQLLALQADGQTYDLAGWKPAKEISVVRHAAATAFYYSHSQQSQEGPVSCRQLSDAVNTVVSDPSKVQVYGESTGNQWTPLTALPDLSVALEAFQDPSTATATSTAASTKATATASNHKAQEYDVSMMIYDNDDDDAIKAAVNAQEATDKGIEISIAPPESQVQDEFEAFLNATDDMGPKSQGDDEDEDDEEAYESDGGTRYVRDPRTGNWIHEDLAPPKPIKADASASANNKTAKGKHKLNNNNNNSNNGPPKKKSKKAKFAAKKAKNWIYITGLPPDTNEEEVAKFFSKVGIIDLDPRTQHPKIKVYRHNNNDEAVPGTCKGDASLCFARPESVELALQVLDEAPFRDDALVVSKNNSNDNNPYRIRVERAKFEQRGEDYVKKKNVSQAQRKVAKLAAKQAMDWDDGEFNGRLTGGIKGLHIIVLKRMFHPKSDWGNDETKEDELLASLESKVRKYCEDEFGAVEKITVFSKNPSGVVVVKFKQPGAASDAVKAWNGRTFEFANKERKVEASFWDGVEDFTVRDEAKEEAEMEKRHDAFGEWIESHGEEELPEELRLQVEN